MVQLYIFLGNCSARLDLWLWYATVLSRLQAGGVASMWNCKIVNVDSERVAGLARARAEQTCEQNTCNNNNSNKNNRYVVVLSAVSPAYVLWVLGGLLPHRHRGIVVKPITIVVVPMQSIAKSKSVCAILSTTAHNAVTCSETFATWTRTMFCDDCFITVQESGWVREFEFELERMSIDFMCISGAKIERLCTRRMCACVDVGMSKWYGDRRDLHAPCVPIQIDCECAANCAVFSSTQRNRNQRFRDDDKAGASCCSTSECMRNVQKVTNVCVTLIRFDGNLSATVAISSRNGNESLWREFQLRKCDENTPYRTTKYQDFSFENPRIMKMNW